MVLPIASIEPTDFCVAPWIAAIWEAISSVAFDVCSARLFTSDATTAKPLPLSPARAASMVALSASRVGLRRDVVDQLDDVADPLSHCRKPLNLGVGPLRFLHRLSPRSQPTG